VYNFIIGLVHASVELIVVAIFFLAGNSAGATYEGNLFIFLFGFIGFGGLIHSMIDYNIAFFVMKSLSKAFDVPVFLKAKEMK
jgi:niacin transporter